MKEEVDEHPLASICDSWHLAMNNSASSLAKTRQRSFSEYQNDYSYLQPQNAPTKQPQKQDQGRCYDHLALKIERIDEPQKVMHHFFDESPHNGNNDHCKDEDSSTTQLSISIPSSAHDFFLTHNGNFTSLTLIFYARSCLNTFNTNVVNNCPRVLSKIPVNFAILECTKDNEFLSYLSFVADN